MMGMNGEMLWASFLFVVLLVGFAYIIWVLAEKEGKTVKMVGRVIAAVIASLAVVALLYGTVYPGVQGGGGWHDRGSRMMGPGRTHMMEKDRDDGRSGEIEKRIKK